MWIFYNVFIRSSPPWRRVLVRGANVAENFLFFTFCFALSDWIEDIKRTESRSDGGEDILCYDASSGRNRKSEFQLTTRERASAS